MVTNNVYNNFNNKIKTIGFFIDFKMVFDLVEHDVLLNKMEAVGI